MPVQNPAGNLSFANPSVNADGETTLLVPHPSLDLSRSSPGARERILTLDKRMEELWSAPGAVSTAYSLTTSHGQNGSLGLAETTVMGPLWNIWGIIRGLLSAPDDFAKAKQSAISSAEKHFIAVISLIYYAIVLSSLTAWAYATAIVAAIPLIKQIGFWEVFKASAVTLGNEKAWAASDAAFGGDLLLCAIKEMRTWNRAKIKSNPIALLEDRCRKYIATINNHHIPAEKKSKLRFQLNALFTACKNHADLQNELPVSLKTDIKQLSLPKMDINVANKCTSYLLNKQFYKLRTMQWSILGNMLGVFGAGFGSASMLVDEYAKPLLWPSAIFYIMSAAVKCTREFNATFCGEVTLADPEKYIREQLAFVDNADSIGKFVSRHDLELTKAHSAFLWGNAVGLFGGMVSVAEPLPVIVVQEEPQLLNGKPMKENDDDDRYSIAGMTTREESGLTTPRNQVSSGVPTPQRTPPAKRQENSSPADDPLSVVCGSPVQYGIRFN